MKQLNVRDKNIIVESGLDSYWSSMGFEFNLLDRCLEYVSKDKKVTHFLCEVEDTEDKFDNLRHLINDELLLHVSEVFKYKDVISSFTGDEMFKYFIYFLGARCYGYLYSYYEFLKYVKFTKDRGLSVDFMSATGFIQTSDDLLANGRNYLEDIIKDNIN